MIARRVLLLALVAVLSAGAGLAARELRASRADVPAEQAGDEADGQAAAAPAATPVPKWSTRRVEVPAGIGAWSLRLSPDGTAIAGITAQPAGTGVCTVVDKVSPPTCQPPVPSRAYRYRVNDPVGVITATLTPVGDAPENGGFAWLPDGGLLIAQLDTSATAAKLSMKSVTVTILESDGRRTPLGNVEGGGIPSLSLSPDGKWLAVGQTQPPAVRFVDRKTGSSKTVAVDVVGLPVPLGWARDGRVLLGKDSTVLRVSSDGAVDRIAGPVGARLSGVASVSSDGSIAVFRANRPQVESLSALVDGRWIDVPMDALRSSSIPTWVTPHELLLRTAAGALHAFDPRTGATRDLGFTMRAADPRFLGYSEPYLIWRDGNEGRIHLLDLRSAYDVIVGTSPVVGVQPYSGGGFLLLHQDGAELLTAADFFARVPPTAAPFVPAAPLKPGAKDPFADIKTLPRLDQYVTGGALDVASRSGSSKRVRSPDGGWSLEVPADWRADVGRLRGGEFYSFDPTGMDNSGNSPPLGGVRMSLTLWPDFDKRGAVWFADHQGPALPATLVRDRVTLGGITAERAIYRANHPPPFNVTTARWYLSHPAFDDRLVEVILFRADDVAIREAERVLATLEFAAPISGPREPLLSRAKAIAKVIVGPAGKPTPTPAVPERVEAKLATQKEFELAQKSGSGYLLDADTPVWVVVRFGDFEPNPRSMRGPGPFLRWTWQFSVLDARTGQGFSGGGGSAGSEPAWWASLRDRAS